jgi:hypothetical protein
VRCVPSNDCAKDYTSFRFKDGGIEGQVSGIAEENPKNSSYDAEND